MKDKPKGPSLWDIHIIVCVIGITAGLGGMYFLTWNMRPIWMNIGWTTFTASIGVLLVAWLSALTAEGKNFPFALIIWGIGLVLFVLSFLYPWRSDTQFWLRFAPYIILGVGYLATILTKGRIKKEEVEGQ